MAATDAGWKWIQKSECPHISGLKTDTTSTETKCRTCGDTQDLRLCMTCGFVGCCESHGAHDTDHYKASGHPFIKPHLVKADWLWCYACNAFLK